MTEDLREFLKNAPKLLLEKKYAELLAMANAKEESGESSSDSSSSDSESSSSESSSEESSQSEKGKKKKGKRKWVIN